MPIYNNKRIEELKRLKNQILGQHLKIGLKIGAENHRKIKIGVTAFASALAIVTFTLGLLMAVNPRPNLAKTIDSKLVVNSSSSAISIPNNLTSTFNFIPINEISSSSSTAVSPTNSNSNIINTFAKNLVSVAIKFTSPNQTLAAASLVLNIDKQLRPIETSFKYVQGGKTLNVTSDVLNVDTNEVHYGVNTTDKLISSIEANTVGELDFTVYVPDGTPEGSYSISSKIINAQTDTKGQITSAQTYIPEAYIVKVTAATSITTASTAVSSPVSTESNTVSKQTPANPNSLQNIDNVPQF